MSNPIKKFFASFAIEEFLEPKFLGELIGVSAITINKFLLKVGYQIKVGGKWKILRDDLAKGNEKLIYGKIWIQNYKWNVRGVIKAMHENPDILKEVYPKYPKISVEESLENIAEVLEWVD
jgi:hypothetical protein